MQQQTSKTTTTRRPNGAVVRAENGARVEIRKPSQEIRFEVVTMTPDEAKAILAKSENAPRRSLSRIALNRLVADIQTGTWNGRTNFIAFDKLNHLIDGWHRVSAIAEAGKPVQVMVGRGFQPEEVFFFDRRTQPRRIRHILQFNNYKFPTDGNIIAAIARLRTGQMNAVTPEEALSMLERYEASLNWIRSRAGDVQFDLKKSPTALRPNKKSHLPTPIKAALVFVHSNPEYREDAEKFMDDFLSNAALAKSRQAPRVLRKQFEEGFFRGGGTLAVLGSMYRALRCFNSYVLGEDVGKLKTPNAHDARALVERFYS